MKRSSRTKKVTDRANRYRAQRNVEQRAPICMYCGARGRLDVEHINGIEGDSRAANLGRACRPCNATKGQVFARAGIGVRTVQANPDRGARSAAEYARAVAVLLGRGRGALRSAVSLVYHTAPDQRAKFAAQLRAGKVRANPGAKTMAQYVAAGQLAHDTGDLAAKKLVDDTPMARKKRFSQQVWDIRRQRYGPSGRRDGGAVPF